MVEIRWRRSRYRSLEVVRDEHLSENAFKMGELFRGEMERINNPMIKKVRGKGLLNAVVTEPKDGKTAWDICLALKENGLIAKLPTIISSASRLLW